MQAHSNVHQQAVNKHSKRSVSNKLTVY